MLGVGPDPLERGDQTTAFNLAAVAGILVAVFLVSDEIDGSIPYLLLLAAVGHHRRHHVAAATCSSAPRCLGTSASSRS